MATAAANDPRGPLTPGDVVAFDPRDIELGERLRPIDEAWATAIGQSMKRDGQINPVAIHLLDGRWTLAGAGGHRVMGARLADIPIDAKIVMFDQDTARRREAAENLFRRANDPLERAEAIAELVRLHREKAGLGSQQHREGSLPKRLKAEAEGTLEIVSNVYGWSEEIGSEIGLTGRTIRNDLFLYRGLKPSVIRLLRDFRLPVLKNAAQLRALAKLDGPDQVVVVNELRAGAKSVSEAVRLIGGSNSVKQSAEEKRLSTFIGTFARMSLTEKRGALAQLAGMLPAPFKLVEDK